MIPEINNNFTHTVAGQGGQRTSLESALHNINQSYPANKPVNYETASIESLMNDITKLRQASGSYHSLVDQLKTGQIRKQDFLFSMTDLVAIDEDLQDAFLSADRSDGLEICRAIDAEFKEQIQKPLNEKLAILRG